MLRLAPVPPPPVAIFHQLPICHNSHKRNTWMPFAAITHQYKKFNKYFVCPGPRRTQNTLFFTPILGARLKCSMRRPLQSVPIWTFSLYVRRSITVTGQSNGCTCTIQTHFFLGSCFVCNEILSFAWQFIRIGRIFFSFNTDVNTRVVHNTHTQLIGRWLIFMFWVRN